MKNLLGLPNSGHGPYTSSSFLSGQLFGLDHRVGQLARETMSDAFLLSVQVKSAARERPGFLGCLLPCWLRSPRRPCRLLSMTPASSSASCLRCSRTRPRAGAGPHAVPAPAVRPDKAKAVPGRTEEGGRLAHQWVARDSSRAVGHGHGATHGDRAGRGAPEGLGNQVDSWCNIAEGCHKCGSPRTADTATGQEASRAPFAA